MRKLMTIAVGVALLASAPLAASAQPGQHSGPPGDRHDNMQPNRPGNGPGNGPGRDDNQYGRWDNGWGNRPPPPPKAFAKRGNWYQHVRACSARYRSYNPRTDTYQVRRGVVARCRL